MSQGRGTKRKRMDLEGDEEVSTSGKRKINLDTTLRDSCMATIILWFTTVLGANSDYAIQMMACNLIYNAFQTVRQSKNANQGNKPANYKREKVSVHGHDFDTGDIYDMVVASWKTADGWLGTMSSLVCLTCWVPKRMASTRVMPTDVLLRRSNSGDEYTDLKDWGIGPEMRNLCDGIGLSPSMRSNMAQSLGPLTIAISLARSKTAKYAAKWKDAFIRVFNNLPGAEGIADFLAGVTTMKEVPEIFNRLGKIATVTGTREQHRVCFLPRFLMYWHANKQELGDLNFSGPQAFVLLANMFDRLPEFVSVRAPNSESWKIVQAIFHTCAGTQFEDIGILSGVTTSGTWNKRKEMESCFKYLKTSNIYQGICNLDTGFNIRLVSKAAGASMTNFQGGSSGPISGTMVFAGFRTRLFTKELREYLTSGKIAGTGKNMTATEIIALLDSHLKDLLERFDKVDNYEAGTVDWHSLEMVAPDLTIVTPAGNLPGAKAHGYIKLGNAVQARLAETGEHYWSN